MKKSKIASVATDARRGSKAASKSLSVIIPVYNEEKNLANAAKTINSAVKKFFYDYELIILNDASTDKTAAIATALAKKDSKIRFVDFKINRGFGAMYREGVTRAKKEYLMMVPGDNEILGESIENILSHTGEADVVLSYTVNKEARPLLRQVVSTFFTSLLNFLFGFKLKYYIGMVLYKTALVQNVKMTTNSFAFQAEILIRLLKSGYSYKEVPMMIRQYKGSLKNLFRIKNLIGVLVTVLRLLFDVYIRKETTLGKTQL
ncbi:glycosyltransferase family 2 protein [Candidatus Woesearchaeota archaeon]|nr:glycosyltransferase family 2 protein [Candidatus Woesearchaeota archaeon]